MKRMWAGVLLAGALASGCREADAPLGTGRLFVDSDPRGARIYIDDDDTGLVTPDTIFNLASLRDVRVELDSGGYTYRYTARVLAQPDEVTTVHGPLMARCTQAAATSCSPFMAAHTVGAVRFVTGATGVILNSSSGTPGLVWPVNSSDRYVVGGAPVFAARYQGTPVALHPYDQVYLIGRPAPVREQSGGTLRITQTAWVLPPLDHQDRITPRGLEIRERVVAADATAGVIVVELRFRNISAEALYQLTDAGVPAGGVTWEDVYIGLGLDPDIGNAADDFPSYDPQLDAVFAYDAAFSEPAFSAAPLAPGLVGLRVVEAPAGAGVVLNAWELQRDWSAGTTTQPTGFGMTSGTSVFTPDHPGTEIGYLPAAAGDMRVLAAAGPVTLAPGDSARIVLAVAVAAPVPGTFTPGTEVTPGDPTDTARPLHAIAAALRERLAAADVLLTLLP